jgi:hypothetical protein
MTSEDNKTVNAYWRVSDAIDILSIAIREGKDLDLSPQLTRLYNARNLLMEAIMPPLNMNMPVYDSKTDGDYSQWLASNNID